MKHKTILVVGGSGFIGRHLVARLSARGLRVIVPTRRRERVKHNLLLLPTVDVVDADVHDDATLASLLAGADAAVNLVGILHGRWAEPWGPEFQKAHVDLPARLAKACAAAGVRRLLHVSALGVSDSPDAKLPSMYLRSKAAGENAVRETPGLDWTIFRPSVVFGPDDSFLNTFAKLQRFLPVMALARADARFQPVFVGDVATAMANALDEPATFGKSYELAGPGVFTLRELVEFAGRLSGRPRPVIGLPDPLGVAQAQILEMLPGPLMSRDNFDSMAVPNVASGPIAPELGLPHLTALNEAAASYLATRQLRLDETRGRAHR